jgi:glycosyltransferase involved in cell wall biosynthesis
MNLNVLFLSSWFPSKAHPTLGNFVQYHAEAIAQQCNVTVLYLVKTKLEKNFSIHDEYSENVRIIRVFYPKNGFLFLNRWKAFQVGLNYLSQINFIPNLIHFNVIWPEGWQAIYAAKKFKIPFCITDHWTGYHAQERSPLSVWQKMYMRLVANKAQRLLPVTNHMGLAMQKLGFKTEITVIPNVVNTNLFRPQFNLNHEFQFLHVSHLGDHHKNISGILRTWKNLTKNQRNIHLKIGGDGPLELWKTMARELEIPPASISFFGTLSSLEVAALMNQSHCFVLFSNYENLPLVMIEAMSCGLTVITTDVGGCKEFLPLEHGHILIEKKDEADLLNAMQKIIDTKEIQSQRKKIISDYASNHFSNETIANQIMDVYTEILKSHAH